MFFQAAFAHHPGPVLPELAVGADDRLEKGRLALHEESKARQSIEKLAKQDPAPNPWAVVILEQEVEVVAEIEEGLVGALLFKLKYYIFCLVY